MGLEPTRLFSHQLPMYSDPAVGRCFIALGDWPRLAKANPGCAWRIPPVSASRRDVVRNHSRAAPRASAYDEDWLQTKEGTGLRLERFALAVAACRTPSKTQGER